MLADGVLLSPKSSVMTYDEIYEIAKTFVRNTITKIRLTGGESLIRKDVIMVTEKLASLPLKLLNYL